MLRQLLRNRLSVVLLIVCCLIAIGGIYKSLWHTQPTKPEDIYEIPTLADGKQTEESRKDRRFSGNPQTRENNFEGRSHHAYPPMRPTIPEERLNRIEQARGELHMQKLQDGLTPYETNELYRQKSVSILTEGMDDLSAARYLKMLGGYDEYAREYAARALDENPDDFEGIFIWTKLHELDADRKLDSANY